MRHPVTIPQNFCELDDIIADFMERHLRKPTVSEVTLMKSNVDIKYGFDQYYGKEPNCREVLFVGEDPCYIYW